MALKTKEAEKSHLVLMQCGQLEGIALRVFGTKELWSVSCL